MICNGKIAVKHDKKVTVNGNIYGKGKSKQNEQVNRVNRRRVLKYRVRHGKE